MKPQNTKKLIGLGVVALALLFGFSGIRTAAAQEPTPTKPQVFTADTITMEARAANDGYFKYSEWLIVWVEVGNSGADVNAEVRIQIGGANPMTFTAPVELPAGARKRVPVYVLPNNFSRQLVVELVATDGRQLATRRVDVNPQPTITYMVGLISPERGALTQIDDIDIPGQRRPVTLVDVPLDDIPEKFEALRTFDLLVINNTDTSALTPGQVAALEGWVSQGGRLVIGGGAGAQMTLSGLGQSLAPLKDISAAPIDALPGLQAFAEQAPPPSNNDEKDATPQERPILVPGPFMVASGQAGGSPRILARQDNLALITEWALDRGFVDFVALDVSGSPFDAWNGVAPFWERLAGDKAAYPEYAAPDMSARQQFASSLVYPLSNLPMLDLPSVKGLALLLGVYIVLVGPVNYLILRRRNRFHLAWITIPAITLIFSLASFGLGYLLHGSDIFINKIAVIQAEPSGRAHVDSFIGLFSPAQSAYEVQVKDGGLISPLNPYSDPWSSVAAPGTSSGRGVTLIQGNPAYMRGLSVEQWSMQSFMSEGQLVDFGKIETDLRLEGDAVVGEVHNNTPFNLKDAAIVVGSLFTHLGDLPAGGSSAVNLSLVRENTQNMGQSISYALFEKELSGASGQPGREVEVRRAIVEALLERTPPYISAKRVGGGGGFSGTNVSQSPVLLAWLDQAPPQVLVSGADPAQQTTAIVVLPISYSYPQSGDINLPPGLVPGTLVETPREGGTCGMAGSTAVYISRGEAVFEYTLPAELTQAQIRNFKINIWSDAGFFNPPEAAVYDWQAGNWVPLKGLSQGVNLIPASPALISEGGAVRLQLSGENLQYCYYVDMGVEATR